jgi:hypothetical protein
LMLFTTHTCVPYFRISWWKWTHVATQPFFEENHRYLFMVQVLKHPCQSTDQVTSYLPRITELSNCVLSGKFQLTSARVYN